MFKIGVIGYCYPTKFDFIEAWKLVKKGLNEASGTKNDIIVVGGLTDIPSIHQIAYYQARQRNWNCGGYACEKAKEFKWFPMSKDGDELKIVGKNWGDESETFINNVDILVRIGGGPQSHKEVKIAKAKGIPVLEYDFESEMNEKK